MPWNTSGTFAVRVSVEALTANREILWPDIDGTLAVGVGIGSGVSILALHRTDMTAEGGELRLHRAVDDGLAWAIDVNGTGSVATALRFINMKAATVPMHIDQSSGDVVIGKLSVSATATHAGFTLLGSDAPSVKMKKLTGTTAAVEGGTTSIAHGLTGTKILSAIAVVDRGDGTQMQAEHTFNGEHQFSVYWDVTNVNVQLHSTNSGSILSKAIRVLVTYEV